MSSRSQALWLSNARLVDDADPWPAIYGHSYHRGYVVQMAFGEPRGSIQWVYPDDHLLLEKLVRELIIVVVCLWSRHAVYLLHLLEVCPVAEPLHVVVVYQHLLADVHLVELVRHYVGLLSADPVDVVIFFTDDSGSGVQLLQVVDHSVLDVHVGFGEHILLVLALDHACKVGHSADSVDDTIGTLKELDTGRKELI